MSWLLGLFLVLGCSGDRASGSKWQHTYGVRSPNVLDLDLDVIPTSLECEQAFVLLSSSARMVGDCETFRLDGAENPVCRMAVGAALAAVADTRCPDPPPVDCPLQTFVSWRGWSCAEKPELNGTFANCTAEVQVSCSQI